MEDVTKMAEAINKRLDAIEATAKDQTAVDAMKAELEAIKNKETVSKSDFEKLNADIDALAKTIKQLNQNKEANKSTLKDAIKKQIEANKSKPEAQKQIKMIVKADNMLNIQVIDGGSFDEDEANLDATLLTESAIETGIARDLRRDLTLLSQMTGAVPLRIGDALKWIEPTDADSNVAIVKEANTKPSGAIKYARKSKESTKVAIKFVVSEEFLNRADFLMIEINAHFRELLTETLEEVSFDATTGILSYATTYVNPVGYAVTEPTKLDAINAVAVSMKLRKYKPSHVVLNSADIAMMFADKGLDGQYRLANGQSIQLIDGGSTLVIGTTRLSVIEVNSELLGVDDFVVADWSKLKFGLGSVIVKSDPYSLMEDNIVKFIMEAPFCVALPANYPYAVVSTDFTTVKEAIEIPAPAEGGGE